MSGGVSALSPRLARLSSGPSVREALLTIGAVAIALLVGALLVVASGESPVAAFTALVDGALGSSSGLQNVVLEATPLILIGVGLAIAFRARLYNIGAEGQFCMGAIAGTIVALQMPVSSSLQLPVLLLCGAAAALGGGLWAGLAGVLRARWRVNEVVSTLLLTFIAIYLLTYLTRGPLREPGGILPQSSPLPGSAQFSTIGGFSTGIIVALVLAAIVAFVMRRTTFGFSVRAFGLNPETAESAGLSVRRLTVGILALSGAFAGLAGFVEIATVQLVLAGSAPTGLGYTGIIVALLGRLQMGGVVLAGVLIAVLDVGANAMERETDVPFEIASIIQILIVVFLVIGAHLSGRRDPE